MSEKRTNYHPIRGKSTTTRCGYVHDFGQSTLPKGFNTPPHLRDVGRRISRGKRLQEVSLRARRAGNVEIHPAIPRAAFDSSARRRTSGCEGLPKAARDSGAQPTLADRRAILTTAIIQLAELPTFIRPQMEVTAET